MRYALGVVCLTVAAGSAIGIAQAPGPSMFTEAQASNGKATYDRRCADCHRADLQGSDGPPLAGPEFLNSWTGKPARELVDLVRKTMPPGAQGTLTDQTYLEIVAYILRANG